jgi:hypothetical protein
MSLYLKVWNYFLNIEKRESYFGKMKMKSTQGDQISDAKICHYSVRSLMIRTKYVPIRILDMNYRLIYITYYDWLVLAFVFYLTPFVLLNEYIIENEHEYISVFGLDILI